MAYDVLYAKEVGTTHATVNLSDAERFGVGRTITLYRGATQVDSGVTDENGDCTFTGLTPATSYTAKYVDAPDCYFTTLSDSPKVALESQWRDLANRVKAKADKTYVDNLVGGIETVLQTLNSGSGATEES